MLITSFSTEIVYTGLGDLCFVGSCLFPVFLTHITVSFNSPLHSSFYLRFCFWSNPNEDKNHMHGSGLLELLILVVKR